MKKTKGKLIEKNNETKVSESKIISYNSSVKNSVISEKTRSTINNLKKNLKKDDVN